MSVGVAEDHLTLYPEKFSTIGFQLSGYFSGWPILGRNRADFERFRPWPGRRVRESKNPMAGI